MNAFIQNVANQNGADLFAVLLGILVFGAIVAAVLGVRYLLDSQVDVVDQRVKRFVVEKHSSNPPPRAGDSVRPKSRTILDSALKPLVMIAKPTNEGELGRLQSRLSYAGIRGERAMFVYLATKVLLSFAFAGVVVWYNNARPQPLQYTAFLVVFSMFAGFYLPSLWLQNLVRQRQTKINRALPDTLDLLVTCVDSGLGLDASMNRVAEEISLNSPLLSQEIMQAAFEIRAGSSRGEAFRRLAARTGVEDIRNLSSIVVQTEVFGTSMAKALRVMAEGMRVRRMQKAEEKGAQVGVKMTIPLVLCILPALFSIIMGPAVVQIVRRLMPTLGGGH
jgi:tight adherence protein C